MWEFKVHLIFILLILSPLVFSEFTIAHNIENPENDDNLILVQTVCRHGARNIFKPYVNDPWKSEEYWRGGFGQLTDIGIQQQYELGQFLRKRYKKLIGSDANSLSKVYVESSDTSRTILSAKACLTGLFSTECNRQQTSNQIWDAIPVHIVPKDEDYILQCQKPCKQYEKLLVKQINPKIYDGLFVKYAPLIKYLKEHSGENIRTFNDIATIHDTLSIEKELGFELPSWATKLMNPGDDFEKFALNWFVINATTTETMKLTSGFLLKEILDHCTNKTKSMLQPDVSLWMYFAHDTTLTNLLNTLKLYTPHFVSYTACIIFELYQNHNGPYLQVLYRRNSTQQNIEPLVIPDCGLKCSLDEFYKLYADTLPAKSFNEECMLHDDDEASSFN